MLGKALADADLALKNSDARMTPVHDMESIFEYRPEAIVALRLTSVFRKSRERIMAGTSLTLPGLPIPIDTDISKA